MSVSIHPITLGFDDCYIIRDRGTIMIDGGAPQQAKKFAKALEEISVKAEDVKLIVITHGHWDHIGSAREIKELTGAKIAMHRLDKYRLEESDKSMPPGVTAWGKIFGGILKVLLIPMIKIPPAEVDIVIEDEGMLLEEYGIPGRVIYTPGHSPGSVSILLESGEAFVGDMAMNKFPLRLSPGMPIFAEDSGRLKESWNSLLNLGAKTIYPSHGEHFPVDVIQKALSS